ncbi:MAG TPA: dioxygenase [Candidatus Dormibacteraeota bacterium]|jgi:catechol 1,2-dioxygenase
MTAPDQTGADLTARAVDSIAGCPDPRLREVLGSLIRNLHHFAVETSLTESEWMAGIRFLTDVGHTCTDQRQEFILLSDTLGLSMLVDLVNHGAGSSATESTVLGPFYVPDSPWRANGDAVTDDLGAQPLLVSGHVLDISGNALPGAVVDVWQNATNRLYAVQDEHQSPENLRGRFRSEGDGAFRFRTVRPVDYPIPDDGPVGRMLKATGRHPWRPAHVHLMVSAKGCTPVTTHLFDSESKYLDSDVVFGVKQSLVRTFTPHDPASETPPPGIDGPWYTADIDIVLQPSATARPKD